LARALREHVAFVPGRAAFVDGRGGSAMRLNFSGVDEDAIREGIRRIGEVVREQVAMYGTLTGTQPAQPARQEPAAQPDVTAAAARIAAERAAAAAADQVASAAGEGEGRPHRVRQTTEEELAKVLTLPAKHKRAG
jgi:hypothetical protein